MLYSKKLYSIRHLSIENKVKPMPDTVFSVILENTSKNEHGYGQFSIINSIKPLAYFSSIFGNHIVRYKNNDIDDSKLHNKIYSLCVIAVVILTHIFIVPKSWKDTKSDIPLNILTKCFGFLVIVEVAYFILISTFGNGQQYYKLLKKLDNFDQHFITSKTFFMKIRIVAIFTITWVLLQFTFIFILHPFSVQNTAAYLLLYTVFLQGAIMIFLLENIYSRLLVFNELLMNKILNKLPQNKNSLYAKCFIDQLITKVFFESQILKQKLCSHYSWFELMQMYDKTADCVNLFNKIYAGQVFLMFQSGLFCTMLSICRFLSPSLKNSHIPLSDMYIYTCINARPLFVAKMCEMITNQKNKTLLMLLNILVHSEQDDDYYDQIQTMLNLVENRKMELNTNVFMANLQTVLHFFGRVVSYTVLMIQYFYIHSFSE